MDHLALGNTARQYMKGYIVGELERRSPSDLVLRAANRGVLLPSSVAALQEPKTMAAIDRALADSHSVKKAGRLLLVTMMPDDSISMTEYISSADGRQTKQDGVIAGHNDLLAAMTRSSEGRHCMLQT